jgi:archaemetzincin
MPKYFKSLSDTTRALGRTAEPLSESEAAFFRRLPTPKPGDWLSEREERGQTVDQYNVRMKPGGMIQMPRKDTYDRIMLVPIGASFRNSPLGQFFAPLLLTYAQAFYHPMPVDMFPGFVSLKKVGRRKNGHGHPQYLLDDVFKAINSETARDHRSYCRLGVTFEDIYPGPEWNFVYGQARLMDKIGVFSFARHSPLFDDGVRAADLTQCSLTPSGLAHLLRHAIKTMVHETAHMFQILHCVYYQCLMNGNNGPGERAGKSSFCCPVCLRKLMHTIELGAGRKVPVEERYEQIQSAWEDILEALKEFSGTDAGFGIVERDILWLRQRRAFLRGESLCGDCGVEDDGTSDEKEAETAEEKDETLFLPA